MKMDYKITVKKPFSYYGGKGPLAHKIVPLLPPHEIYVEPFCGSAAIFFAKKPAKIETLNDMDGAVMHFYRVIRDPELLEKLYQRLALTPYSRDEFCFCRDHILETSDPVERAARFFIENEMAFAGNPDRHSWRKTVATSRCNIAENISKYLAKIAGLPTFHLRLQEAQIENLDFRRILRTHNSPETLAYVDPPYVLALRNKSHKYLFDMSEIDHRELVQMLLEYQGMVVISGYDHAIYKPLEHAGWHRTEIETTCHAVGRTRANGMQGKGVILKNHRRIEIVWRNPAAMAAIERHAAGDS